MQLLCHHPHYKVGIQGEGKTYAGEQNRNTGWKHYDARPFLIRLRDVFQGCPCRGQAAILKVRARLLYWM